MNKTLWDILPKQGATRAESEEIPDRDLLELIVSGDREAFALIVKRYRQQLFRIAVRIIKNVNDAEDIVQETFFRAFQNIAAFRGDSSLSSWLTQIVINCALMELRRRRTKRPWLSLDGVNERGIPWMEVIPDPTVDVHETLVSKEQVKVLTACIGRLPPKLRVVVEDWRLSELSMAELALIHGTTVSAAKSRLVRAKARIKRSSQVVNATRRIERAYC